MLNSIAALFFNRVLIRSTGLLTSILLARLLGPELQGQASLLIMVGVLLFTFAVLGLDSGAVYFVRRLGEEESSFFWSALPLFLTGCLVGCGLFVFSARSFLASAFHDSSTPALLFTCGFVIVEGLFSILSMLIMAQERVRQYNIATAVKAACLLLLMAVALLAGWRSVPLVIALYGCSGLLASAVALYFLRPRLNGSHRLSIRQMLSFSLFPWSGNLLNLLSLRIDAIMVSAFVVSSDKVRAEDLGLYTVCIMAIGAAREFQNAIQTVFFPHVAGQPLNEAIQTTRRVYKASFFLFLLVFLAICAFGYPALLLYGREYAAAYPTLVILAFGSVVVRGNVGSLSLFLTAFERPGYPVAMSVFSVIANVLLNLLLLPRFGIAGAALATTLSIIIGKIVVVALFCRETRTSYFRSLLATSRDLQEYRQHASRWIRSRFSRGQ